MPNTRGFTTEQPWILMLVVLLLIAVTFETTRHLGRDARVREALERNLGYLSVAEHAYYRSHGTYTHDVAALAATGAASVTPDSGNVLSIMIADSVGFLATGTSARLRGRFRTCGIYIGTVTVPDPSLKHPDRVSCW